MREKTIQSLKIWQFENFSKYGEINHYVTGRNGGISKGELGGLNLSFKVGDERQNVLENRAILANSMGVTPEKLIFPSQTHSANIKMVDHDTAQSELEDTDALITKTPGILISVMSADCVPILLFDKRNKAVAAIHSGWRGSVSKILSKTIESMKENFDSQPSNLIAGIGPSICQEVYEVGEEVIAEVAKEFGDKDDIIRRKSRSDKGFINLWKINERQLLDAGVLSNSIEIAEICTYTRSDEFFSARKSGNKAGRFAAGIMLN